MDLSGSLNSAKKHSRVRAALLISLVGVSIVSLTFFDIPQPWTAVPSFVSAISGAMLGNYLRDDYAEGVVKNQARPAIRHLFGQINRLRGMVLRVESWGAQPGQSAESAHVVEERLASLGVELRNEIEATSAAIDHWGDLSPEVQAAELDRYKDRENRIPEGRQQIEGQERH